MSLSDVSYRSDEKMTLRPLNPADAAILRAFRLAALSDTPRAFGSTFERESAWTDQEWQTRAADWSNGKTSHCVIATDDDSPCGIAAGFIDRTDASRAWLVSMWVAPAYRRKSLGQQLVAAIEAWARSAGASSIALHVTEGNTAAETLYARQGYAPTGERGPHEVYADEVVYVMAKKL